MDFYEVVKQRRSYRAYRPESVPEDAIERISTAVALAPTACNRQPFRILLVRHPAIRASICDVYRQAFLKEAPIIAVALGNEAAAWRRLEGDSIINVDVAIAMEHLVLAAAAEKLGTCWICAFDRAALDRALELSPEWHAVAISPLGYPVEGAVRQNTHKQISELIQVLD